MRKSVTRFNESDRHIIKAEQTLFSALGLDTWQPLEPLTYERPAKEAFAVGRLDAEHFKPKFTDLEKHIFSSGSYETLDNLLDTNQRGKQPDYADEGMPVVNSKHVASGDVRIDDDNRFGIVTESALTIRFGDVLMNGTGVGTIGRTAPYLREFDALPDNHVTVLRLKNNSIDPIYLSIYLNSLAGQYQVDKWLRGSSGQIELYPNDIGRFIVWKAPVEIQQKIRQFVESSFTAKILAKELLDRAKRAVEIAIEESEEAGLRFLRGEAEDVPTVGRDGVGANLVFAQPKGQSQGLPLRNPIGYGHVGAGSPRPGRGNRAPAQDLPIAAEPPPFVTVNPIPARLLAAMQPGRAYSRAELLAATGITEADWIWAIRQLKEEGFVMQEGEKRGARYRRK